MILFIHGTDSFQIQQKMKEFRNVAIERNGDFNVDQFDATSLSFVDFQSAMEVVPFLGDKRLIIFSGVLQKDAEFCSEVLACMKEFDRDDLNLIFVETDSIDKRKGLSKFMLSDDSVKRYECNLLEGAKLNEFIRNTFVKKNISVNASVVDELIISVGNNLSALENEIEKISLYANGSEVTVDICRMLVSSQIHSDVFKMIDAISKKNFVLASKEFHKLLQNGDSEFYLFTMLVYQFRNIVTVKYLSEKGMNESTIAKSAKLHPFVVKKTLASANAFSFKQLQSIYHSLYEMDRNSKSVSGFDLKMEIDLFTYQLCR